MSDLIDRQTAIDLWEKYHPTIAVDAMQYDVELRQLPPAQSEQRWIPVTEALPETSDKYLVTALEGIRRMVTLASYHPRTKQWSLAGRAAYWRVTAWQPLPAAYREEEQE